MLDITRRFIQSKSELLLSTWHEVEISNGFILLCLAAENGQHNSCFTGNGWIIQSTLWSGAGRETTEVTLGQ